ncbi:MAG TPA: radical SAM protein [Bacteroidales bacterium]|nr:radical SAM protein [Bacteroidales bacterium]
MDELVFGPVPSRRLGISLGVNNIPHKVCSYSCAYCQVGKSNKIQIDRQVFYSPETLTKLVEQRLKKLKHQDYPSYITIVPNGEPTLDINLGKLIENLKAFGLPVAVITNSSLIHRDDVKKDLLNADYLSFKIDTVNRNTWKQINKPHRELLLGECLNALLSFKKEYHGKLITETMLIKDKNESDGELSATAEFLQQLKPSIAYLSIPTRPPAFKDTSPPNEDILLKAYEIFNWYCLEVKYLSVYEGNEFSSSGDFEKDLLSITAVHPMRIDAVKELMLKTKINEIILQKLVDENKVKRIRYQNQTFIVRTFNE